MAYIHCHNCDWQQHDFYSPGGYNPAHSLESWNNVLFGPDIDRQFSYDAEFIMESGPISKREVLARQYEKFASRIRKMKWITWDDYKKDPNKLCPKCGQDQLDID